MMHSSDPADPDTVALAREGLLRIASLESER